MDDRVACRPVSVSDKAAAPRVAPATRDELGPVNALLLRVIQRGTRTANPPNLFATLGRHRGLFRRWLFFAGALMPRGKLPRADTELVILRVSHLTGCPYEADYHVPMGRKAGLSAAQVDAVARDEIDPADWSPRQAAIVAAVDELHRDSRIGDETFAALRGELSDRDLVELCMLAGHYEMVAGTINSLGIQRDEHRR
jgi:AhpD family alkylhydroperoxidase